MWKESVNPRGKAHRGHEQHEAGGYEHPAEGAGEGGVRARGGDAL